MRVLIINVARERFSVGKIAYSFCEALNQNGIEALLAYGFEYGNSDKPQYTRRISNSFEFFVHHCINAITGYHSTWAPFAMRRLQKIIDSYKPDIIQLYNIHGYYLDTNKLFDILSQKEIPIVYGMLDEYAYMGYCAYSYDCDQFIDGCNNCKGIHIRGYLGSWFFNRARQSFAMKQLAYSKCDICFTGPKWVIERAKKSALLRNAKLYEVDEFIDTDNTFVPRDANDLKKQLGINSDQVVILNVAPSGDPRKGVKDFIWYAKNCDRSDIIFVNVGNQEKKSNLPSNYIGVPFVTDQIELSMYYSMADVFFCTSYADTMPNTCLEALSCGTPVLGYNVTGIPYVAEAPFGAFYDPKNRMEIGQYIKELDSKTEMESTACRDYAVKRYSLETYMGKQLKIYEEVLRNTY